MNTVIFLVLAYTGGILSEKLRKYAAKKSVNKK
jgi:hypothetical protein